MDFHSVNTSSAACPASRCPLPVPRTPPNGNWISAPVVPWLMYTSPLKISRLAVKARFTSCVKMEVDKPYCERLLTSIASSSEPTSMIESTGPMIYSVSSVDRGLTPQHNVRLLNTPFPLHSPHL